MRTNVRMRRRDGPATGSGRRLPQKDEAVFLVWREAWRWLRAYPLASEAAHRSTVDDGPGLEAARLAARRGPGGDHLPVRRGRPGRRQRHLRFLTRRPAAGAAGLFGRPAAAPPGAAGRAGGRAGPGLRHGLGADRRPAGDAGGVHRRRVRRAPSGDRGHHRDGRGSCSAPRRSITSGSARPAWSRASSSWGWRWRSASISARGPTTSTGCATAPSGSSASASCCADQAVTEERVRIARELHDVVAHNVSLMVVQAQALAATVASEPAGCGAARRIGDLGREAMSEMHRMLGVLRLQNGAAADRAPQPGVRDLAAPGRAHARGGLEAKLIVEGEPRELPAGDRPVYLQDRPGGADECDPPRRRHPCRRSPWPTQPRRSS